MDGLLQREISCPYCGETITAEADPGGGEQAFIEDCPVCCCPIEYRLHADAAGWQLLARRDDEA